MNPTFLEVGSVFLHRGVLFPSFQIFGNFLGDSPRKANMWKHVVDNLGKRLAVWRGKLLSVGGRVVLINYVLNAVPIFTLSLYKAPLVIIKEIVKIQSNFLWGDPPLISMFIGLVGSQFVCLKRREV